jgi:hypothetical protein
MRRLGALDSSVRWLVWNVAIEAIVPSAVDGRYLQMRYEDVVGNPEPSFKRILSLIGAHEQSPVRRHGTVTLSPSHCIASNPGRTIVGATQLAVDDTWMQQMSVWAQVRALIPALPRMTHYGYRPFGADQSGQTNKPKVRRGSC